MEAEEYLYNMGYTEEQVRGKIKQKIASVGGLLSEEGALLLIAGEKGWKGNKTLVFTDLSDKGLDDLFKGGNNKSNENTSYIKGPLTVKILKIYDAEKSKSKYIEKCTKVKVSDGINERYFQFDNKGAYTKIDEETGESKTISGNFMSDAIQAIRKDLVGRIIEIYELKMYLTENGNYLISTTGYTHFDTVNTEDPENERCGTEEVAVEEVEEVLSNS